MFEYCYFFNYLLSSQGVYADSCIMGEYRFSIQIPIELFARIFSIKYNDIRYWYDETKLWFHPVWLIFCTMTHIYVEVKSIIIQFTIYFPGYSSQLVLITVIQYVYLKRIPTYMKIIYLSRPCLEPESNVNISL